MATADQILRRVLVRCGWPSSGAPLTDEEILDLVDEEITSALWPQLLDKNANYHLTRRTYTLQAGTALYRLPSKVWGPIKEFWYVDAAGKERDLTPIDIGELGRYVDARPGNGSPFFVYIDGDFFGVHPVPTSTEYSVRVVYRRAPNVMCLESAARRITATPTDTTLTLASTISGWDSSSEVEIIGSGGSHQVLADEQGVTSVVGTTLTLDAAYPSTVEEGDWVSLSGTTPVAPVPDHMISQLCDRVAAACMNSNGDQAGFTRNAAMANDREKRGAPADAPRQEAEPDVIVPHSSPYRMW